LAAEKKFILCTKSETAEILPTFEKDQEREDGYLYLKRSTRALLFIAQLKFANICVSSFSPLVSFVVFAVGSVHTNILGVFA